MKDSVKEAYNLIANDFSLSRNYDWPEFDEFYKVLSKLFPQDSYKLKILDLWCWNWRLVSHLEKCFWTIDYLWVDISSELIKIASNKHKNRDFVVWDMTDLSFIKTGTIDIIWSIASFHHLPSITDRINHLQECKRVLKNDWIICMTNWNLFQLRYLRSFFSNFFRKKAWNDTYVDFKWANATVQRYYHAFTLNEINKLFEKTGLYVKDEFFMKKKNRLTERGGYYNLCHVLWKAE